MPTLPIPTDLVSTVDSVNQQVYGALQNIPVIGPFAPKPINLSQIIVIGPAAIGKAHNPNPMGQETLVV